MCGRSRSTSSRREHTGRQKCSYESLSGSNLLLYTDQREHGIIDSCNYDQRLHLQKQQDDITIPKTSRGGALLASQAGKQRDSTPSVVSDDARGNLANSRVLQTETTSITSAGITIPILTAPSSHDCRADNTSTGCPKPSATSLYSTELPQSSQTAVAHNGNQRLGYARRPRSACQKQRSHNEMNSQGALACNAGAFVASQKDTNNGSAEQRAPTRHRSHEVERMCDSMQNTVSQTGEDSSTPVASAAKQSQCPRQDEVVSVELHNEASISPRASAYVGVLASASTATGNTHALAGLGSGGAANRKKAMNMETALKGKGLSKKAMMAQFLRKNNLDTAFTIFVLNGQDYHIREALLRRELTCVENCVPNTELWNLKWCVNDCETDYKNLQKGDLYNHFQNNRELTTKAGLTQNLQRLAVSELLDVDSFFPRSYDMSLPSEREDFILDFRRCAALRVALQHRRLRSQRDNLYGACHYTCSATVLQTATKALQRWACELDGSHFDEVGDSSSRIDDEAWDDLVLYSEVTDAQLCQLEAGAKRRERNRGFSVSGGVLVDADSSSGTARQSSRPPVDVQAWPEFVSHHWTTSVPQALQIQLDACIDVLETTSSQIYAHGPMNVWIVKPGTNSKASGIMCMSSLPEVLHHCKSCGNRIIQKYIERPLLLFGGRKFDIRQWVLVRSFAPLEVYMFSECYLRLCNKAFDLGDLSDRQRHLSNWSVNKHGKNVQEGAVASLSEFSMALQDITGHSDYWETVLQPKLKDVIMHSLRSVQDCVTQRPECFELYGFDFMVSENLQPWLLEVNLSPACEARTPWISALLERMSTRLLELVLDGKSEPDGVQPDWICISGQLVPAVDVGASLIEDGRLAATIDMTCAREDLVAVGHGIKLRNLRRMDDVWQKHDAGRLIQRVARGFLTRHRLRQELRNRAAISIQRMARKSRFLRMIRRRYENRSSLVVQCAAHRFLAVSAFLHMVRDFQATVVQRTWRGYVGRRLACFRKRERAAEIIQHHWWMHRRRVAVSKIVHWWIPKYREIRLRKATSALYLQSFWRGEKSRRLFKFLRIHVEYPTRKISLLYALARWRHQNSIYTAHVSARRLQIAWRRFCLQRVLRRRILRRKILRSWQRNSAAVLVATNSLQRCWRTRQACSHLARVRSACILLQRAWRARIARRYLEKQASACIMLQGAWRAHVARRCLAKQTNAAVRVQAAIRGWISYRFFLRSRKCAIVLQSAWRRTLASRDVHHRRLSNHAAKIIQRSWRQALAYREARWLSRIEPETESCNEIDDDVADVIVESPAQVDFAVGDPMKSIASSDCAERWAALLEVSSPIFQCKIGSTSDRHPMQPTSGDCVENEMPESSSRSSSTLSLGFGVNFDGCNSESNAGHEHEAMMYTTADDTIDVRPSTSSCISSELSPNQSTRSTKECNGSSAAISGVGQRSEAPFERGVEDENQKDYEAMDMHEKPPLMRVDAVEASRLVAVRSESGTNLHAKSTTGCALYPPMQLLSAPPMAWVSSTQEVAQSEEELDWDEAFAKRQLGAMKEDSSIVRTWMRQTLGAISKEPPPCSKKTRPRPQESNSISSAPKAPPPANVRVAETQFEAQILDFVYKAENRPHECMPKHRDAAESAAYLPTTSKRPHSAKQARGYRSGGSALHAARELRDATTGLSGGATSSQRRSTSCRRSSSQQQAAQLCSSYGFVAKRVDMDFAGPRSLSVDRSGSRNAIASRHDETDLHGRGDEARRSQRRLTRGEILEIALNTETVGKSQWCTPRPKLGQAVSAVAGLHVEMICKRSSSRKGR